MQVKDLEHTSGNGVVSVSFSFFTPEQLRALSVKQITRGTTFDRLGRPQRDGLYDPSLGPVDTLERCETCALSYDDCPGERFLMRSKNDAERAPSLSCCSLWSALVQTSASMLM